MLAKVVLTRHPGCCTVPDQAGQPHPGAVGLYAAPTEPHPNLVQPVSDEILVRASAAAKGDDNDLGTVGGLAASGHYIHSSPVTE